MPDPITHTSVSMSRVRDGNSGYLEYGISWTQTGSFWPDVSRKCFQLATVASLYDVLGWQYALKYDVRNGRTERTTCWLAMRINAKETFAHQCEP